MCHIEAKHPAASCGASRLLKQLKHFFNLGIQTRWYLMSKTVCFVLLIPSPLSIQEKAIFMQSPSPGVFNNIQVSS